MRHTGAQIEEMNSYKTNMLVLCRYLLAYVDDGFAGDPQLDGAF